MYQIYIPSIKIAGKSSFPAGVEVLYAYTDALRRAVGICDGCCSRTCTASRTPKPSLWLWSKESIQYTYICVLSSDLLNISQIKKPETGCPGFGNWTRFGASLVLRHKYLHVNVSYPCTLEKFKEHAFGSLVHSTPSFTE